MRLIDADALIEQMRAEAEHLDSKIARMILYGCIHEVEYAPTVDVVERKRGKWIDANPMSGRVGKVCSACGNEAYCDSDYGQQLFDWCPYCGAKMEA